MKWICCIHNINININNKNNNNSIVKSSRNLYLVKLTLVIVLKMNVNAANYFVDNVLDIVIPKVSKYTSARYIAQVLFTNKIAMVRSVKLVPYTASNGYTQKRAIIHLACWFNNAAAYNLQRRILDNGSGKLVHKSDNAWTIYQTSDSDKYMGTMEVAYFKIHNTKQYGTQFQSEYYEKYNLIPVIPKSESAIQYMYYKPVELNTKYTTHLLESENIIEEVRVLNKLIDSENAKIVQGLKDFTIPKKRVVVKLPRVKVDRRN